MSMRRVGFFYTRFLFYIYCIIRQHTAVITGKYIGHTITQKHVEAGTDQRTYTRWRRRRCWCWCWWRCWWRRWLAVAQEPCGVGWRQWRMRWRQWRQWRRWRWRPREQPCKSRRSIGCRRPRHAGDWHRAAPTQTLAPLSGSPLSGSSPTTEQAWQRSV
jgi:hypothetical protein